MPDTRKKILIVDDAPINLKMVRNVLAEQYDVFTAPSAEKMFDFLGKLIPDLILLDVLMPDVDGYTALVRLRGSARTKDIPVVFLTSRVDTGSEIEGLELGATDYISKSINPQLLLKRVGIHLQLESQKKELLYINTNLQALVEAKTNEVMELQDAILTTVSNLVEFRDDVTGEHVTRTSRTLNLLIEEMLRQGIYRDEMLNWDIKLIVQSSQLHDVGKISVSDRILLKPGSLTEEEYEEMKKHAAFGEDIIDTIQRSTRANKYLAHARIMAGTHHEKWDGSGYPRGLSGENIPLQGRLMAFADVYDALVSERAYKKAFPHEEAVKIIEDASGSHFDPAVMAAFSASAFKFPH
ncbi:MAG: response regulator [Oscillospiraceae bacterium]|jgi:putative two-component system response regulator|nr:response regulator [Oscillospiraceae bacterium]